MSERKNTACHAKEAVPPLKGEELSKLAGQVSGWKVVDEHHLEKQYTFPDFKSALDFV